jgi:hypothetical protein
VALVASSAAEMGKLSSSTELLGEERSSSSTGAGSTPAVVSPRS